MKKKTVAMVLATALCFGCAVGGTLAWLTDETETVTNTFTTSEVDIELTESKNLDLQMVPGKTITKDPEVTVIGGSEDCYVFVKIEKSANYGTYLNDYVVAEGWTALTGVTGVYYREVAASTTDQKFSVLDGDKVTVKTTVTNDDMKAIVDGEEPTLTFTAYAIQMDYLSDASGTSVKDAASAWELIPNK